MRPGDKFLTTIVAMAWAVMSCQACVTTQTNTSGAAVCANLASLGCYEGQDPYCAATVDKAEAEKLTDLKPACLVSAKTVGDVLACGTVECTEDTPLEATATCTAACDNVKALGCPEATDCLATCNKVTKEKLTDLKLPCLAKAKTRTAARACGTLSCQ